MMNWGVEGGGVDELESSFGDLNLEKSVTSGLKTAEEIESLTVDEQLGDIERAVYLLSSGQEIQRISVIKNLPDLLRDNNVEAMRRVVPKVREVLHLANQDLQEAATKSFVKIAEEQSVPHLTYAQTFLQTILQNTDNRDPDISDTWLDVLLEVIAHLPKEIIKKDILTVALAKGQLAQSVQSRLASCRILGKIATRFDTFMIKKDILPLVTALCQDVDYEVRACMCKQLDVVARGLGLEPTRSAILPELVELGNDEESCVRLAALETVVSLLSLLDDVEYIPPDTCTQTIIPMVSKFCDNAMHNEDATLPAVAKQFGRLCHGLLVNLTEEQKIWFLKYYYRLCVIGLNEKSISNDRLSPPVLSIYREEDRFTECRQHSAYNFPCMVLFAGPRNFKAELHGTFANLCDDPNPVVRRTCACGFHEVAGLLGNNTSSIQSEFISLLKDDNLQVVQGIIQHLPETLAAFAKGSGMSMDNKNQVPILSDVIPALLAAESKAAESRNWRLHAEILDKFSCLPKCLTSDQIHSKFLPLVFKYVTSHRALPVQHAAARTLCVFMRNCRKLEQRQEMCSRLKEECCHSKSSRYRRLFIDICVIVMEMFSKAFFKDNFMEPLMELTSDPVPNIRLRMCSILPKVKHQMKLPRDREHLQELEMVVRRLLSREKDRDVDTAIRQAVFELDRIQTHVESISMPQYYEEDLLDQKKEEEERLLVEMEKRSTEEGAEKGSKEKGSTSSSRHPEKKKAEKEPKADKNTQSTSNASGSSSTTTTRRVSRSNSNKHVSVSAGSKRTSVTSPTSPTGPPMHTANRGKPASHKAKKSSTDQSSSTSLPVKSSRTGKKSPSSNLHEPNNNVRSAVRTGKVVECSTSVSAHTASSAAKRASSGGHVSESRKGSASSVSSTRSNPTTSSHLSSTSSTRVRKSTHKT